MNACLACEIASYETERLDLLVLMSICSCRDLGLDTVVEFLCKNHRDELEHRALMLHGDMGWREKGES